MPIFLCSVKIQTNRTNEINISESTDTSHQKAWCRNRRCDAVQSNCNCDIHNMYLSINEISNRCRNFLTRLRHRMQMPSPCKTEKKKMVFNSIRIEIRTWLSCNGLSIHWFFSFQIDVCKWECEACTQNQS